MADSVEILVHISAPSTVKDDTSYRGHADAYMEFEPVSRVRIYPEPPSSENAAGEVADPPHADAPQTTSPDEGEARFPTNINRQSQKEIPNFVATAKSTPVPSTWGPSFGETTYGLLDLSEISVQRSFSQNDTDAVIENSFLSTSDSPKKTADGPPNPPTIIPSSQATETPPSEVPESQASFQASWNVEKDNSPPAKPAHTIQIGRLPFREELNSQPKRPRLSVSPACIPSSIPAPSVPTSSEDQSKYQPQSQPHHLSDKSLPLSDSVAFERLSSLPLEINPPRPTPSSTAEFTTHITPTLQMLSEKLNLSRIFKPARQTRPLRTLERGYWLLNLTISNSSSNSNIGNDPTKCHAVTSSLNQSMNNNPNTTSSIGVPSSPWPSTSFFSFWDFLAKFIAHDGRAGWGVWCLCESATPTSSSQQTEKHSIVDLTSQADVQMQSQPPEQQGDAACVKQLTVKIYTWGEIAPHIYLLMYLASDRQVRKVRGVQWRDGAEEGVIFMD
ncbi:hypothetical protein AJ79_03888 [Helicocarpus griseus UAMH5409]|uniref:Uncharacterized protein n=1 Tax=Helicocarpus griseus UAMH5409 TaxID=1447875 RepID=A0A2B7XWA4_9EURO|nr:hypothetical protein AJ79_03888 [Helicocarpus griseus UAMH5409]